MLNDASSMSSTVCILQLLAFIQWSCVKVLTCLSVWLVPLHCIGDVYTVCLLDMLVLVNFLFNTFRVVKM